ncbi:probable glucose N-acetyltransferase 1 [Coccomyxa sp. Obi]|nr:probable glucose N-acetyltransferase 1 [Coccomyxa sp. Obi]
MQYEDQRREDEYFQEILDKDLRERVEDQDRKTEALAGAHARRLAEEKARLSKLKLEFTQYKLIPAPTVPPAARISGGSVINAHRLDALNVRETADTVVLYNNAWDNETIAGVETKFTKLKALQVRLVGVQIVYQEGDPTWAESLTKLSIFKLTDYRRIIYFDVDGLVMKNMNHLFSLPPTPIAMPRAHWLEQPFYSDQIAVIEPSERRLEQMLAQARRTGGYDMDVVNDLYKGMCMVLPNEYDFLSGELRRTDHAAYLGNSVESSNSHSHRNCVGEAAARQHMFHWRSLGSYKAECTDLT